MSPTRYWTNTRLLSTDQEHYFTGTSKLLVWLGNITAVWTNDNDDVIKWKHFPRCWPFVRGIYRSPANSPHKGQWRRALMSTLICAWINAWVNNRGAGDLRRHRAHYDVIAKNIDFDIKRTQFQVEHINLHESEDTGSMPIQIAKTLETTSIRHRSDTFASDRCIINIDQIIFAIWVFAEIWLIIGDRLNINMPSYQYRDPHVKHKTVSRPSYL